MPKPSSPRPSPTSPRPTRSGASARTPARAKTAAAHKSPAAGTTAHKTPVAKATPAKSPSAAKGGSKKAESKRARTKSTPAVASAAKAALVKTKPAKAAPAVATPVKQASPKRKPKPAAPAQKALATKASTEKNAIKPAPESTTATPAIPRVGARAPSFSLQGDDGLRYSNSSMKGRRFVLYFYPKDDTPGCTKEACGFTELSTLGQLAVPVLGVSRDSSASHAKFRAKYGLRIALLSDPDARAAAAFGAWGPKTNYGKTSMGIIRSTFVIGADGNVERVYHPVRNAAEHPAKVAADLQSAS